MSKASEARRRALRAAMFKSRQSDENAAFGGPLLRVRVVHDRSCPVLRGLRGCLCRATPLKVREET